jgi:hypothetical protein
MGKMHLKPQMMHSLVNKSQIWNTMEWLKAAEELQP